jgi:hypothetical protein
MVGWPERSPRHAAAARRERLMQAGAEVIAFAPHPSSMVERDGLSCHSTLKGEVAIMGDPGSPSDSDKPNRERRSVPRYTLIATVDVVEPVSSVRISGRISELSRKGCYVDALNNLPPQTPVNIRISRDSGTFT